VTSGVAAAALLVVAAACSKGNGDDSPASTTTAAPAMDDLVHLNEIQVVGTHNSFHRRLPPKLLDILRGADRSLADSVDFEHRPIPDQLDAGVRQLELDVWADPDGGRYASHAANALVGEPKETGDPELLAKGFKVLHLPEVDFATSCTTLRACLGAVADWSDAHPRHVPIMVFVEPKDEPVADVAHLGFATPAPIGAAELDALDAEVVAALGADRLLTPDEVRGTRDTLRDAVTLDGWPTLRRARGKVLVTLLDDGAKRDAYVAGHPSLQGRAMFTTSGPNAAESAVVSRPDARTESNPIAAFVRLGFLVRTRADADTVEARKNDPSRRDAALASAATWVSTDFPFEDPAFPGYSVAPQIRCNPVTAPPACKDAELE
jgi:hypothetical protein